MIARRAWECAVVLLDGYSDRLTADQRIRCLLARMAGPDNMPADLLGDMIATAAQVIGNRT